MTTEKTRKILAELGRFDTPTVCNALEFVLGGRRADGFTHPMVIPAQPKLSPLAGIVATARIRSRAPAKKSAAEAKKTRIGYYEYIAAAAKPTIVVIQDLDDPPGLGAMWGEVNVAVHKGLGIAGALTNGSMRDQDVIDPWFPLFAGSITPSHAFVHVVDFDTEVEVFGQRFAPGDYIHLDRHGAVRIPADKLADVPKAVELVIRKEAPILKAAKSPGFSIETLKKAFDEADDIH
jgi:regulator of RNase E activity RraA